MCKHPTAENGSMASSSILYKACAKINLYLDVIGKRPDGFHNIETIFQSISLHDTLKFASNPTELEILTAHPQMPPQEQNLVYKAALVLQQETETSCGAGIALDKNIPIAAGLAGGSADAATTLAALNLLWETGLDDDALLSIAARVGSDVPFCFLGGTAAGTGRGQKLTTLPPLDKRWLVIVTPPFAVSTADAYTSLTVRPCGESGQEELTDRFRRVLELVRSGNVEEVLYNAMERVVTEKYPEVGELKRVLERAGCTATLMSGSGPAVFGFVPSRDGGIATVERLKRTLPDHFVALSGTSDVGWERLDAATDAV
jgi:4-diphosphocytidyl-2-C-methyl-D-erythritol kinase